MDGFGLLIQKRKSELTTLEQKESMIQEYIKSLKEEIQEEMCPLLISKMETSIDAKIRFKLNPEKKQVIDDWFQSQTWNDITTKKYKQEKKNILFSTILKIIKEFLLLGFIGIVLISTSTTFGSIFGSFLLIVTAISAFIDINTGINEAFNIKVEAYLLDIEKQINTIKNNPKNIKLKELIDTLNSLQTKIRELISEINSLQEKRLEAFDQSLTNNPELSAKMDLLVNKIFNINIKAQNTNPIELKKVNPKENNQ